MLALKSLLFTESSLLVKIKVIAPQTYSVSGCLIVTNLLRACNNTDSIKLNYTLFNIIQVFKNSKYSSIMVFL